MTGPSSYHLKAMHQCVTYMRRLEKLGISESDNGQREHGWSHADSYEDSRSWAQYHAGQIIGRGLTPAA